MAVWSAFDWLRQVSCLSAAVPMLFALSTRRRFLPHHPITVRQYNASCRKTAWGSVQFCRRRPEGVLGEGTASPSPPVRGLGERCKLPLRGPGGAAQQFFCTFRFPCSLFCYSSCISPSICMQQGVLCQPPPCGARNYMSRGVLPAVARGFLSIRTLVYARPYLEH